MPEKIVSMTKGLLVKKYGYGSGEGMLEIEVEACNVQGNRGAIELTY